MAAPAAFQPCAGWRVGDSGAMRFGDLQVTMVHFTPEWRCTRQGVGDAVLAARREQTPTAWLLEGQFQPMQSAASFTFRQQLRKSGVNTLSFAASLQHPVGIATNALALSIRVPVQAYDGKALTLDDEQIPLEPRTLEKSTTRSHVRRLLIPTPRGQMEVVGDLHVVIQDGRGTRHPFYRIRLMFSECRGTVRQASLNARFSLLQPHFSTVDLRPVANMGFRDETDGDRKGGWTDQGAGNDIRMLKPGRHVLGAVPLHILDPRDNEGKSCLVFAGPQRDYLLHSAMLETDGAAADCLYLLHATAWTPPAGTDVGSVTAVYDDGATTVHSAVTGTDVGNWFLARNLSNGAVVWTGTNPKSPIGLYLSKFRLAKRPLRRLEFRPSQKAVWMVVAASTGPDVPVWVPGEKDHIYADNDWKPFEHRVHTRPGSILDFSGLVDAPAGKYGPIVVRKGQFEATDRPGVPTRFFGTNICHMAAFQEHEDAERMAQELVRKGYNSARLHHIGAQLPKRGGASSTDFDPERLDQLDYLFHCLKEAGLYVSIDLYTTRTVLKGELPEVDRAVRLNEFKALMAVSPTAMQNWKTYARNLLTHHNPYTGLCWKDDPALFSICIVNEGNLSVHWDTAPDIAPLYVTAYTEWLAGRDLGVEDAPVATSAAWTRFITERNQGLTDECTAHVRSLGTTALLTDVNYRQILPSYLLRDDLDYVDNHTYWDLKRFLAQKWRLPYGHRQLKDTAHAAATPRVVMPTRHFGKPFMVTEFNYCFPNHYRAEGGPLMGAYAALQDWSGIYRYCYAHHGSRTQQSEALFYLDNVCDPVNVLSDRIASLLFLRGDVSAATTRVPLLYGNRLLDSAGMLDRKTGRASDAVTRLGLLWQIGAVNEDRATRAVTNAPFRVVLGAPNDGASLSPNTFRDGAELLQQLAGSKLLPDTSDTIGKGIATSETGQLRMRGPEGVFAVVTPRTECFVLAPQAKAAGNVVHVTNDDTHAVLAVSAMDGLPLVESRRLLVIHLNDAMNSGIQFDDEGHRVLTAWGGLPVLIRRGSCTIRVQVAGPSPCTVHALGVDGAVLGVEPHTQDASVLTFTARTATKERTCLAYEILR